ncbi:response regulator transcription factor [Lentzea jiangxiensis]|uniref:Response regulatory domain-containing protein n=1 Tax=Lentzea jiangxiensis TaxID=641025 RepID=A0A1H0X7X4_9PSEU|nr:response regulator transcription factor [Lentzea jiangxiensis]SDP98835.1 hypothetical protein SAMN05421507_1449 [Lentzea jiangxiensis]
MTEVDGRMFRVVLVARDHRVLTALRQLLLADADIDVAAEVRAPGPTRTPLPDGRISFVVAVLDEGDDHDMLRLITELARDGVPVVVLSFDPGLRGPALDAGACRFLDKVDGPERLLDIVEDVKTSSRSHYLGAPSDNALSALLNPARVATPSFGKIL